MTYQELNASNLESVLSRFNRGSDGLIERIDITYEEGARWPTVNICLLTQDERSEDGWSNLFLSLSKVTHLKVVEGESTYRVLSDGLILKILEGKWLVGVDEEQNDADTIDVFTQFPFGFVASRIEWAVG